MPSGCETALVSKWTSARLADCADACRSAAHASTTIIARPNNILLVLLILYLLLLAPTPDASGPSIVKQTVSLLWIRDLSSRVSTNQRKLRVCFTYEDDYDNSLLRRDQLGACNWPMAGPSIAATNNIPDLTASQLAIIM